LSARALGFVDVLRHGAADLMTASAFLLAWLLRDHFEYDTLRSLLLWPVIFECYLAFALFLMSWIASVRSAAVRWLWILSVLTIYLAGAWLTVAIDGMPAAWAMAFWLLLSRAWPPTIMRVGSAAHLLWLQRTAGYAALLWGAGFVLMLLLMLALPGVSSQEADGTLCSTLPAWIFPLVWVPYFIAEAWVRSRQVLAVKRQGDGGNQVEGN
jgi:hypothetical protein